MINALSRKKFVVWDSKSQEVLGHFHRETGTSYYAYEGPADLSKGYQEEVRIRKADHISLVYSGLSSKGFHAFFEHNVSPGGWVSLTRVPQTINQILENLTHALGAGNFVLSSGHKLNKRIRFGVHSVICKTSADAVLAGLIMNHT